MVPKLSGRGPTWPNYINDLIFSLPSLTVQNRGTQLFHPRTLDQSVSFSFLLPRSSRQATQAKISYHHLLPLLSSSRSIPFSRESDHCSSSSPLFHCVPRAQGEGHPFLSFSTCFKLLLSCIASLENPFLEWRCV